MANEKVDKELTAAAALVSSLITASDGDEALSEFRRERIGNDAAVSVEQLRAARDVLLALAKTIGSSEQARWLALTEAAARLGVTQPPEAELEGLDEDDDDERPTERAPDSDARPMAPSAEPSLAELALAAETMARREVAFGGRSMSAPVYAVLCATCGAFPDRVRETHAKFGIPSLDARTALDEAWQRVFDEEPRLRELWDALFKQFRAWLIQYGHV